MEGAPGRSGPRPLPFQAMNPPGARLSIRSAVSHAVRSRETGHELGTELLRKLEGAPLSAVLVYASVEHDQAALLAGLQGVVGAQVKLLGCSAQGVMARGTTLEGGYFAAALALGGALSTATARVDQLQLGTRAKGQALGEALLREVAHPRLVLVFFDPLAGSDLTELLAGLAERVRCPVAGGAASQPWGPLVGTFQYLGTEVFSHGAVALALDGPFALETAASHGTEPVGLEHTVTRTEGTQICEFDGVRASDVWEQALGTSTTAVAQMATLAVGLPNESDPELGAYRVLSPMRVDAETGTIGLLASVQPGTRAVLHYRTTESVLGGTRIMGAELASRLRGRQVKAVLAFECGARTEPFLGREATRAENLQLQEAVAPEAEWLGLMAWGEILPLRSGPVAVNYTYPVLCLLET
jgi:hypothetical protein